MFSGCAGATENISRLPGLLNARRVLATAEPPEPTHGQLETVAQLTLAYNYHTVLD